MTNEEEFILTDRMANELEKLYEERILTEKSIKHKVKYIYGGRFHESDDDEEIFKNAMKFLADNTPLNENEKAELLKELEDKFND